MCYEGMVFLVAEGKQTEDFNPKVGGLSLHRPVHKRDVVAKTFYSFGLSTYTGSIRAEEKIGVLILNLGGPDSLHDVQPFLLNLFADPDIIRIPRLFRFLQCPLVQFIFVLRALKSKERCAAIGDGSPL
uniref:Ferrochelatase n=1 Tax=Solanum lycopersicum TaxID=4081 RepID=A0A3Q7IJM9_SOLLC